MLGPNILNHALTRCLPRVPVYCIECGHKTELDKPGRKAISIVVLTGVHDEIRTTARKSRIAADFFKQFPNSKHPLIIKLSPERLCVLRRRSKEQDAAFEAALEKEVELKRMIENENLFNSRTLAESESILEEREAFIREKAMSCPACKSGWVAYRRDQERDCPHIEKILHWSESLEVQLPRDNGNWRVEHRESKAIARLSKMLDELLNEHDAGWHGWSGGGSVVTTIVLRTKQIVWRNLRCQS